MINIQTNIFKFMKKNILQKLAFKILELFVSTLKNFIRNYSYLFLILFLGLSSCVKNDQNIIPERTITQIGKFELLLGGKYYGIELESLVVPKYGNFGLGALSKLKGENIIFDNKNYFFGGASSGIVTASDSTPFQVVCNFEVDFTYNFNTSLSYFNLKKKLDSLLPDTANKIYAIRIEGIFDTLNYRHFPDISTYLPPFPVLSEVLKNQIIFTDYNTNAILIGYRFPHFYNEENVHGYHFHNIDNTYTKGGHVLAAYSKNVRVTVGTYSILNILKY